MSAATAQAGWGPLVHGQRVPGWVAAFSAWSRCVHGQPFAWGRTDCNVLALEAVDRQRGSDYAARLRFEYADLAGAVAYQRDRAWDLGAVLVEAGMRPVREGEAWDTGDILLAPREPFTGAHVVIGARLSLSSEPDGCVGKYPLWAVAQLPGLSAYTFRWGGAL